MLYTFLIYTHTKAPRSIALFAKRVLGYLEDGRDVEMCGIGVCCGFDVKCVYGGMCRSLNHFCHSIKAALLPVLIRRLAMEAHVVLKGLSSMEWVRYEIIG